MQLTSKPIYFLEKIGEIIVQQKKSPADFELIIIRVGSDLLDRFWDLLSRKIRNGSSGWADKIPVW